jgi:hypothetical protein
MTADKRRAAEPFLNTVARKLGHAAGTLTNVAQELTQNLSTLPDAVSTKVREAARANKPTRRPQNKKKPRRAATTQKAKGATNATSKKRSTKPNRGRRPSSTAKKKK